MITREAQRAGLRAQRTQADDFGRGRNGPLVVCAVKVSFGIAA